MAWSIEKHKTVINFLTIKEIFCYSDSPKECKTEVYMVHFRQVQIYHVET